MKIISLVPSLTEMLLDFELSGHEIIGRTKFCIHPNDLIKNIPKIGGTKNLNLDKIISLKPDLIFANKEENEKKQVEELSKYFKVLVTDVQTIQDQYEMISSVGFLLKKVEKAEEINKKISEILTRFQLKKRVRCAYLIWKDPYMTVGKDTFIHEMLAEFGFENILKNKTRYPIIELKDLQEADVILLSSEPYPFKEKHILEIKKMLPKAKVILADGEIFSWYGTRIMHCEENIQLFFDEISKQNLF